MENLQLYTYFRSSAAYRVRIALNLKGLDYASVAVHLVKDGGQQHSLEYRKLNPMGGVPVLLAQGAALSQSMAILEYLEETCATPALLPNNALGRARVRAIAQAIACDIHPLNNLRVLTYLSEQLGVAAPAKAAWYQHWVAHGLAAVEQMLSSSADTGDFCHGDTPGVADCCLVPQVFNALRFDCNMDAFPNISRIHANCNALPAFIDASPACQADAEE